MNSEIPKVTVALSGGVDSTAAALILKDQGYEVTGVTMRINRGNAQLLNSASSACFGSSQEEDIKKTEALCQKIGIDYRVIDLSLEFKKEIIDYFAQEYLLGKTPNPCVYCNRFFKFGKLMQKSLEMTNAQFFATGHYARVLADRDNYYLLKGQDYQKDQSYFLYYLTQEQLSKILFPIGNYTKKEIRALVGGLIPEEQLSKESQNFISDNYRQLLQNVDNLRGEIRDQNQKVLGFHNGYFHYTIGQRKGLGVAHATPLYVTAIDRSRNIVYVGDKEQLKKNRLFADRLNWLIKLPQSFTTKAKIRYQSAEVKVQVTKIDQRIIQVDFEQPVEAVTPGQSIVFYDEDIVIGGGIIIGEKLIEE